MVVGVVLGGAGGWWLVCGGVPRRGWCRGSEVDRCSEGQEADTDVYILASPRRLWRCDAMSGC